MTEPTGLRGEDRAVLDVVDAYNTAIDDNVEDVTLREKIKDAAAGNIYATILRVMMENNIKGRFWSEYNKITADMETDKNA